MSYGLVKIRPCRVQFLDQPELPLAIPFLQLALPSAGVLDVLMRLKPDEDGAAVRFGEARYEAVAVMVSADGQIAGHTQVQGAVLAARHQVNETWPQLPPPSAPAQAGAQSERWTRLPPAREHERQAHATLALPAIGSTRVRRRGAVAIR